MLKFVFGQTRCLEQAGKIPVADLFKVVTYQYPNLVKPFCAVVELFQLQQQAFLQIAGTHTDGVKALNQVKHGFNFIGFDFEFVNQAGMNVFYAFSEIAVIVDGVNDGDAERRCSASVLLSLLWFSR